MTKQELYKRWLDWSHEDYVLTGVVEEDKENFFQDLDAWYESQHIKELNHIKAEIIKSYKEMDEALKEAGRKEELHKEKLEVCDDTIIHLSTKGFDCYD